MADLPFDTEQKPQPPQAQPFVQGAPAQAPQDISTQWSNFLSQPGASQLMLSMGINLMQPRHFGDNFSSVLGRAIGAGAEAATTSELVEGKLGEQEARSQASIARAAQAGTALEREQYRQNAISERHRSDVQARALDMYRKYQKDQDALYQRAKEKWVAERDNPLRDPKAPPPPEPQKPPQLSFDDWMQQFGGGVLSGSVGSGRVPGTGGAEPQVGEERQFRDGKGGLVTGRWNGTSWVPK